MRFGIDFDGTIVLYDALFHRLARERFALPASVAQAKPAIREWFWSQKDGRERWIELQGLVYGPYMLDAEPAPGCREFLQACADRHIPVALVSHKTEYPVIGPRVSLREQATAWLARQQFPGLHGGNVYFEGTREEKLRRIAGLGCTHFIDDLPEVFSEREFPTAVEQWLYDAAGSGQTSPRARVFASWKSMQVELEKKIGLERIQP